MFVWEDQPVPTKRRIVIADLDEPTRSIVNECLPHDHCEITEFDESKSVASSACVDFVIFRAPKDLDMIIMPFDAGGLRQ